MKNFIQSIDREAWNRIIKGLEILYVTGRARAKTKDKYINEDWRKISTNAKALNILYCALDVTKYNCILDYTYAKEVWDKL